MAANDFITEQQIIDPVFFEINDLEMQNFHISAWVAGKRDFHKILIPIITTKAPFQLIRFCFALF